MKVSHKKYTIGVVGLWHLGEIYSAGLAELGHRVTGFDDNKQVVARLNQGHPPLAEPDLERLIGKNTARRRLAYSSDFGQLSHCDVVWLAFDTPVDDSDEVQLKPIWNFFKRHSREFKQHALIVISSQAPVGTCGEIAALIKRTRPGLRFELACAPENLQLGRAVKSFFEPGRIVIGADSSATVKKVSDMFAPLAAMILPMNLASAEMSKHALNAFLATSLSFIYDIADVSQAMGADVTDVAKALRSDPRIGPGAYLDASLGFSGGTLARDLKILMRRGRERKVATPVIASVFEKNNNRRALVRALLASKLGRLNNKKIALFGLTYKPGTSTLRRALSLEIVPLLQKAGAIIHAHDPGVDRLEAARWLAGSFLFSDPYEAARDCDAVVFITDWPQFHKLNFKKLKQVMKVPRVFFDTRNAFHGERADLEKLGFTYLGAGVG